MDAMGTPVQVLEGYGQQARPAPAVLVMTRGSALDAPPGSVGAVVMPDIDGALRRPTLDAAEDALRLACVVAGWTVYGRRDVRRRVVVVQTREPEHHAIRALQAWDPGAFWRTEASIRGALRFPPMAHAIRVSVGPPRSAQSIASTGPDDALTRELASAVPVGDDVLGPFPSDGRQEFLVKSSDRDQTLAALAPLRSAASRAGVDVRVDVDPVDAW